MNLLSLIPGFKSSGAITVDGSLSVEDTEIVMSIRSFSLDYMEDILEQMEEMEETIIEENTIYEYIYNTETLEVEQVQMNTITVIKNLNEFNYSLLLAYLKLSDGVDEEKGKIDIKKSIEFMDSICSIKQEQLSETEYSLTNIYKSKEEIADTYFDTPSDRSEFIASYAAYKTILSSSVVISTDTSGSTSGGAASFLSIPLYLQYSGSWANVSYGDGTISQKGCAPTCLAMVLSYELQETILPDHVVAYTGNSYYVPGAGSSWGIFAAVASYYGIPCSNLGKSQEAMISALRSGRPVIASMSPGTFTKGGHFIVLTGISEDGKITVNDPNDNSSKNHAGRTFDIALIMRESKNFWAF